MSAVGHAPLFAGVRKVLVPVSPVLKQVRICTMRLEPRYDVTAESALQPIADFNILDTQIHVSPLLPEY